MTQVLLDSDGLPRLAAGSLSGSAGAAAAAAAAGAAAALGGSFGPAAALGGAEASAGVKTGTTIVACCYAGGVVLGADSRTSAGPYVVNRAARKITRLGERICVCRSGSAADTQALAQVARLQLQLYSQELPRHFKGAARVRVAAHLLQQLSYEYKDVLTAGLIVAGWDPVEGPQAFSIPIGGSCIPVQYTAGGSGSVFITAFLDEHFRPNMSKEEATQLVAKAVAHAIRRDGSSGGLIRIVTIEKDAMDEICIKGDDLPGGA